jgi:hypothetical protein
MHRLKERVEQLESILVGVVKENDNPLLSNRLDTAISFVKDTSMEVAKIEKLLENLLNELGYKNILSSSKINEIKLSSDLQTELSFNKSKLADLIRRENEISMHQMPLELKEGIKKSKKDLVDKINSLELQLKMVKE